MQRYGMRFFIAVIVIFRCKDTEKGEKLVLCEWQKRINQKVLWPRKRPKAMPQMQQISEAAM